MLTRLVILKQNANLQPGYKMRLHHSTIQRLLSSFLLVLFAFSITPKKVLHDLVANHRDTHSKACSDNSTTKIVKAGFNCNCDNLVVESPFVNDLVPVHFNVAKQFAQQQTFFRNNFNSLHHFYSELRGPPVNYAV